MSASATIIDLAKERYDRGLEVFYCPLPSPLQPVSMFCPGDAVWVVEFDAVGSSRTAAIVRGFNTRNHTALVEPIKGDMRGISVPVAPAFLRPRTLSTPEIRT